MGSGLLQFYKLAGSKDHATNGLHDQLSAENFLNLICLYETHQKIFECFHKLK